MEANSARLAHVLYNLLEATRICGILLSPFIPESMDKLFEQIGACESCRTWDSAAVWGSRSETSPVTKGDALFPRVDVDKALAALEAAEAGVVMLEAGHFATEAPGIFALADALQIWPDAVQYGVCVSKSEAPAYA